MQKIYLLLGILLLLGLPANAQMAKFKALFLFNFGQNIGWPEKNNSNDFIITIIGDSDIADALGELATSRTIGGNNLVVREANSINEVENSHIVFLSDRQSDSLSQLVSLKRDKPVLIVGDRQGLCRKGAGITFLMMDGNLTFEICAETIEEYGLVCSRRLLTLGVDPQ
ncbi:YfiR family protein [Marinilabiliaceae bacterium ANBcel2]|nr:YfiR family protein [Marinilabiliaceae bacterium ANBcel2]